MRLGINCVICVGSLVVAQTGPAFDVTVVKASVPGTEGAKIQFLPGGKVRATNVPLIYLIQDIYKVRNFQVVGNKRWMSIIADGYNSRYEIQAEGDRSASEVQIREMVKNLLAERFQIKIHTENRNIPVYALIPAKKGSKLQVARDNGGNRGNGSVAFVVPGWIQGHNVSISTLVSTISELVDRPVIDKTNFVDAFDLN